MSESSGIVGTIVETLKTIVYALLIAGVFRTVFYQPFWIPSGSMKDTLLVGDFLFVNKMAYGYSYASCPSIIIPRFGLNITAEDFCGIFKSDEDEMRETGGDRLFGGEPERGDIIVFRHPVDGRDFIKRVIGLPGDRIQMRDGRLYINDEAVQVEAVEDFVEVFEQQGPERRLPLCQNNAIVPGGDCIKERFIETLPNGVSHSILNITDVPADNTGVFTVPPGHYFFIGDNRDNSGDSRMAQTNRGVGFVPYEDLIGRADRVIFSSAGRSMLAFWTWRSDRFFVALD